MEFFTSDDVSIDETLMVELPIHQVLLSFNGDVQAEGFVDWWNGPGIKSFKKWCDKNGENYE